MATRESDYPVEAATENDSEVVGLYESIQGIPMYALTDVSGDEAWIAMQTEATLGPDEWR
jgi:hypothetical protein